MSIGAIPITGLSQVRKQIAVAAKACGRAPESVTLLAVSKQQPVEALRAAALAGQRDFGESYAQEALPKMAALEGLSLRWHFIGQLQSNKTRAVAEHFQWVHTVDRDKIATRLHEQRPHHAPPLQVCIQVKLAEEAGKGGVWERDVTALAQHIQQLAHLKLRGLMCIPPPAQQFDAQFAQFQRLHALFEQLNADGLALDTLSMGMSGDYPAAIAAGSTLVRIGTAIFGERQ
jgi:pyridoxal phosphate enzyme (YggS family)